MDNILVYEAGDCGSIPYKGTKFRIVTANLKNFSLYENLKNAILFYFALLV